MWSFPDFKFYFVQMGEYYQINKMRLSLAHLSASNLRIHANLYLKKKQAGDECKESQKSHVQIQKFISM